MINGILYTYFWACRKNSDADIALCKSILAIGSLTSTFIGLLYAISEWINYPWITHIFSKIFVYLIVGVPILATTILFIYFYRHKRYRRILADHNKYSAKKYKYVTNAYSISAVIACISFPLLLMYLADNREKKETEDDYGTGLTIIGVSTDDTIQVYPNPSESDH